MKYGGFKLFLTVVFRYAIALICWLMLVLNVMMLSATSYQIISFDYKHEICMELDDQEKSEQYDGFFDDDCLVSARQKCLWDLDDNNSVAGLFFWFGIIMLLPTAIVTGATVLVWRRMRPTMSLYKSG